MRRDNQEAQNEGQGNPGVHCAASDKAFSKHADLLKTCAKNGIISMADATKIVKAFTKEVLAHPDQQKKIAAFLKTELPARP